MRRRLRWLFSVLLFAPPILHTLYFSLQPALVAQVAGANQFAFTGFVVQALDTNAPVTLGLIVLVLLGFAAGTATVEGVPRRESGL